MRRSSVDALEAVYLVRKEVAGGNSHCRLVDPFFAAWLNVSQLT
jgi:hypothetical protein